jgi:hypothetical protein
MPGGHGAMALTGADAVAGGIGTGDDIEGDNPFLMGQRPAPGRRRNAHGCLC